MRLDGAPGASRTPDLLVRSQLLYPLSYGRTLQRLLPKQDTGFRLILANLTAELTCGGVWLRRGLLRNERDAFDDVEAGAA